MQVFWALLPLLAFFAAFKLADIYVASAVLMVVAIGQLVVDRVRTGHFHKMHILVAVLAVVLGGATLLLHDQRFIQWKATILFWALGLAFLVSQFVGERTLVERLFRSTGQIEFAVDSRHWRALNLAWVAFYLALGALNLYVATHFSLSTWVNFKFYGLLSLNVLFVIPQAFWLASRGEAATKPPEGGA